MVRKYVKITMVNAMFIEIDDAKKIFPHAKDSILRAVLDSDDVYSRYELDAPHRFAMFLAQIAHESDGFKTTREYASGAAYEGRLDLGNTEEGDGRRFRGRGLIQLTGRANYKKFGDKLGIDIVSNPNLVEEFPLALEVSALYWFDRGMNKLADEKNFELITRRINGGLNGYADRKRYLSLIMNVLRENKWL